MSFNDYKRFFFYGLRFFYRLNHLTALGRVILALQEVNIIKLLKSKNNFEFILGKAVFKCTWNFKHIRPEN